MKSNFEERKQNRLEAFERLAAKNESLSVSLYNQAHTMADAIPFGQPILIGHHSEKRDRNYRERIHNTYGKSFEANSKAAYYAQRAESLLNGTAISGYDPNAIDKLEEKLEKLKALQELYKSINKIVRSKKNDVIKFDELKALGLSEKTATEILTIG